MYDTEFRSRALGLVAAGMSLNAISDELGVSRAALRRWRDDPRGSSGGARPCPAPFTSTPAYAALFGYYLGDGCISRAARYHALRIACDAKLPAILADVASVVRAVHPDRPTHLVPAPGCISVQSNWKHWPCLFPQHGPGRKHERTLTMTSWQRAIVEEHPADFLRGLFHSDGSLVKNWATRMVAGERKRYEYPRWQFVNESHDIMRWCRETLDLVGVEYRQTNPRVLSVSRRADVARLTELIGIKQ
ncbi:hypothetical protein ABIE44_000265 [Marmoricola sp. OAE513]|uniref:helix-turn-helix domain-containing protein n=1 Tax=Marmoricola sp. OAE513 TaxID=2817894 RepID=UPI001AE1CC11